MPFMGVEVTAREEWILIDGAYCGDIIPCSVCGELPDYDETVADCPEDEDPDDYYRQVAFEQVSDYTDNIDCYHIEQVSGYGGRLSAPGYMDCTDWGFYESEREAFNSVCELYDLCPICEKSADGTECEYPTGKKYHYNYGV